ncbi:MAG: hypothetical protein VB027_02575 [Gordonibacter sp.]|nr:hypothetical protein [Gordonibacter sp.]
MDRVLLTDTPSGAPRRFRIKLAGLVFSVSVLYDNVYRLCSDYLVDEPADVFIEVTQEAIDAERTQGTWTDGYLESLAVYRAIAEVLPLHERLLIHGAALAVDGVAYLFCAPSGVGKSTHVSLWKKYLGAFVTVVNGDKPLVRIPAVGTAFVCGTPWAGKEGWQENASFPFAGLCFLERGPQNCIRSLQPGEALERALAQTYLPARKEAAERTLELLDTLLSRTPQFLLTCNTTEDAVRCSFEGMTGRNYPARKGALSNTSL